MNSSPPSVELWSSLSSGVDWITCSASAGSEGTALWIAANTIGDGGATGADPVQTWNGLGYSGWQVRGLRWGWSPRQGVLAIASGEMARANAATLTAVAQNVSRLDVQVTARSTAGGRTIASEGYTRLALPGRRRGRPVKSSITQNSEGGSTLYVGSRSSDRYGRVYDKGVESGTEGVGLLWRWEVELKRAPALRLARALVEAESPPALAGAAVFRYFSEVGIPPEWSAWDAAEPQAQPQSSSDDRRFYYLHTAIAPMIAGLIDRHGAAVVLAALGLPHDGGTSAS